MKKKFEYPKRKISEVFLEYSSPLLDTIGEGVTPQQIEKALRITFSVWNAIVLDTVKGDTKYISMLKETVKGYPMESSLIEQFILRKKELYSADLRMIGEYSVTEKIGEWRLRVEARDPYTIP
jgi:hypothetical protein